MWIVWLLIGVVAGSVANAVIFRLPRDISWVKGKSMCTHCKHELGFVDLIPLLSYVLLGGSCRYCKNSIGLRYFVVEALMAVGFAILANPLLAAIFWVTVVIAVMDWETKLVSEVLVGVWAALVLIWQLVSGGVDLASNGMGLVVGGVIIGGVWALTKGKGMGFGDVEIVAVMGWWLGWPKIAVGLWVAFVTGAIIGVGLLARGKGGLKSQIAFGPFLLLGTWISYSVDLTWITRMFFGG